MTAVHDRPVDTTPAARIRKRRRRSLLLGATAASAALVGVSQLVLPAVAEQRVRDRLEQMGTVSQVDVGAFPAVKLLWGQADDATIRMASLDAGPLKLQDVRLVKHGDEIDARASVPTRSLPAIPSGLQLRAAQLPGGRLLLDTAVSSLDVAGGKLAIRDVDAESLQGRLSLHATATLG